MVFRRGNDRDRHGFNRRRRRERRKSGAGIKTKRQRAAAVQDAGARYDRASKVAKPLECASPLALWLAGEVGPRTLSRGAPRIDANDNNMACPSPQPNDSLARRVELRQSGGGLPQSKTLPRDSTMPRRWRSFWSAPALWRFGWLVKLPANHAN